MKARFVISPVVFLLTSCSAFAQLPDSLRQRYSSHVHENSYGYDFTSTRINNRIDSIQLRADMIRNPNLDADQIIRRFRQRRRLSMDTAQATKELDSIKFGLRYKVDSLAALKLPTDKYKRKLDSINQISAKSYIKQLQGTIVDYRSKTNGPMDGFENEINKPVNCIESKVNEKLDMMNKDGGAAANLPGNANIKDLNVPGAELKASLDLNTGADLKVPGVDVNPLKDIKNPVPGQMEQLSALKEKVSDLKSVPQQQVDRLKSIDEVEAVQGRVTQANGLVDKAQAYQRDVSNIANGDLGEVKEIPNAIENKLASMADMKELQEHASEVTQYQSMLAKGNDPKALKELAAQQVTKYATDHFAGKQVALQGAMDKMSKLKSKYPQISSLKDLPKRAPNPMREKPFVERLVPGFAFQIQKGSTFMLDLNPTIGFRFTGRFTAGAGWNERLSFSEWNQLVAQDRIYGPRVFSSFSLKKGFSLKAEVEKMNVFVPTFSSNIEGNRAWVWGVFAGLKKDYTFFKNVKGNVQIVYNLYDDRDNSPYLDKLNVRMGWEFPMKKKPQAQTKKRHAP